MPQKSKENQEFFDDCPICQAMKDARKDRKELTLTQLKDSFKKAKEQGATVGGEEL